MLSIFPPSRVSNSRSLGTAFNSGDSSASRAHIVTVREISRNWAHAAGLGPSLYSLLMDVIENTSYNNFSVIVKGGCLAMARISLMCLPTDTNQCMFFIAMVE
jgi:hypothetical protein